MDQRRAGDDAATVPLVPPPQPSEAPRPDRGDERKSISKTHLDKDNGHTGRELCTTPQETLGYPTQIQAPSSFLPAPAAAPSASPTHPAPADGNPSYQGSLRAMALATAASAGSGSTQSMATILSAAMASATLSAGQPPRAVVVNGRLVPQANGDRSGSSISSSAAVTDAPPGTLDAETIGRGATTPEEEAAALSDAKNGKPRAKSKSKKIGVAAAVSIASAATAAAATTAAAPAAATAVGKEESGTSGSVAGGKAMAKSAGNKKKGGGKKNSKKGSNSRVMDYVPQDDFDVCNVCMNGENYKFNPLRRCCSCRVLVHEHCYACNEPDVSIPEDTVSTESKVGETGDGKPTSWDFWKCDVCAHGEDCSSTPCALCSETGARGGAMKQRRPGPDGKSEWVHVSCALWVPEAKFSDASMTLVHLERIPNDRKALKCCLCGNKGVCVQCAGGRCLRAYHPWCLLHAKTGLLHRALERGSLTCYCPEHLRYVNTPLDVFDQSNPPRAIQVGPRNVLQASDRIMPNVILDDDFLPLLPSAGGRSGRSGNKNQGGGSAVAATAASATKGGKESGKKRSRDKGPEGGGGGGASGAACEGSQGADQEGLLGRKRRRKFGPGPGDGGDNGEPEARLCVEDEEPAAVDLTDPDLDEDGNVIVHTYDKAGMPRIGQEPVTSERFWEVNSSYFPEDHRAGWLDRLIDIPHLPRAGDPIFRIPAVKTDEEKEREKGKGKACTKAKGDDDSGGSSSDNSEDDDDDDDEGRKPRDGKGKGPSRNSRRGRAMEEARRKQQQRRQQQPQQQQSSSSPPSFEFKSANCHGQVGVLIHKHGKPFNSGLRFAFREARTLEDHKAIAEERENGGLEWEPDLRLSQADLDEAFPHRPPPPPPPLQTADGMVMEPGPASHKRYGSVPLPLRSSNLDSTANGTSSSAAPQTQPASIPSSLSLPGRAPATAGGGGGGGGSGGSGGGGSGSSGGAGSSPFCNGPSNGACVALSPSVAEGGGGSGGTAGAGSGRAAADGGSSGGGDEEPRSTWYVALQGWKHHVVNDPVIRFRPRGPNGEVGVVAAEAAATGAAAGQAEAGQLVEMTGSNAESAVGKSAGGTAGSEENVGPVSTEGVPLPACTDEVTDFLIEQQRQLQMLTSSIFRRTIDPARVQMEADRLKAEQVREEQVRISDRNVRVQQWKELFLHLETGMADRPWDFNQAEVEAEIENQPAGWRHEADGRVDAETNRAMIRENVEASNKEDSVCMACFDGYTDEFTHILYCDGCGIPVHQTCYGIQDIEPDFFCDRCLQLAKLENSRDDVMASCVKCALCPVIHGAMKRTIDGRFVHIACLMAASGARMSDLVNKEKIDISRVHLDPHSLPEIVPLDNRSTLPPPPPPPQPPQLLPLAAPPSAAPNVSLIAPPAPAAAPSLAALLAPPTSFSAPSPLAALGSPGMAGGPSSGGGGGAQLDDAVAMEVEVDVSSVTGAVSVGAASPQVLNAGATAAGGQVPNMNYFGIQQQQQQQQQVMGVMSPPPPRIAASTTLHMKTPLAAVAVPEQAPRPAPKREIPCIYCGMSEGALLDCGVTECGVGPGRCRRHGEGTTATRGCCGADGGCSGSSKNNSQGPICHRRFHFLCGWFAGAYVKVSNADSTFTRGVRDMKGCMDRWPAPGEPKHGFPAGMLVEMRCLDHSKGPDGRGELRTSVNEQAKLRRKYRLKEEPDWRKEGTKKKKKSSAKNNKDPKKAEQQSTIRVSGPKPLEPDRYEKYTCAVCLTLRSPVLKSEAALEARGKELAEERPLMVKCSTCGVQVHRECYGVADGVAERSSGWQCAPCTANVSNPSCTLCPRKGGAFLRARALNFVHAYCAARIPGAKIVDPPHVLQQQKLQQQQQLQQQKLQQLQAEAERSDAASKSFKRGGAALAAGAKKRIDQGGDGAAAIAVGGGSGERLPSAIVDAEARGSSTGGADRQEDRGTTLASVGGDGATAALVASGAAGVEPMHVENRGVTGVSGDATADARQKERTADEQVASAAAAGKLAALSSVGKRVGKAVAGTPGSKKAAAANGGGKKKSVKFTPGTGKGKVGGKALGGRAGTTSTRIKTVETKGIPKDLKKQGKCHICKRKAGAMVQCAHSRSTCERWMHPLCAAHVGGRYERPRTEEEREADAFKSDFALQCEDHIPPCLRQLSSGHWVDFLAWYRVRSDLDRARVLLDCVGRREKIKRRLRDFSNEQFDAVLKHTEATAQDWVKEVKSRIAKIDARAAEASRRAAARSAGDEDEGNSRTRSVQLKAREAQEAREAEAAQAAAAAAHQSALAAARKSSRKGGGAAAAKQAAEISWYGCPKLIERDELQYPPVPPPFAGGDGNADRDGSGRRAGRLYSQGGFNSYSSVRRGRGAGPPASPSDATSPSSYKRRRGAMSGADSDDDGLSREGGVSLPSYVSWATTPEQKKQLQHKLSSHHGHKNEPLWKPGKKRPRAGKTDARPECRRACEKMVGECMGKGPLEGVARRALECGRRHERQRRSGRETGTSRRQPAEGEWEANFGILLANLLGKENVETLENALTQHQRDVPPTAPAPAPPRDRILLDRQLRDIVDTLTDHRVDKGTEDLKWTTGNKPDGLRNLGELFEKAPSEKSYPEYHKLVDKVMDLATIREKVRSQEDYKSTRELFADVQQMLTNAGLIQHVQGMADGQRLVELAQEVITRLEREEAENKSALDRLTEAGGGGGEVVGAAGAGATANDPPTRARHASSAGARRRAEAVHCCCCCSRVRSNTVAMSIRSEHEYAWFCEVCVATDPSAFEGETLWVFRDRVGKFVQGTVERYERLSGRHFIRFRDNGKQQNVWSWEFIALGDDANRIKFNRPYPVLDLNRNHAIRVGGAGGGPSSQLTSSIMPDNTRNATSAAPTTVPPGLTIHNQANTDVGAAATGGRGGVSDCRTRDHVNGAEDDRTENSSRSVCQTTAEIVPEPEAAAAAAAVAAMAAAMAAAAVAAGSGGDGGYLGDRQACEDVSVNREDGVSGDPSISLVNTAEQVSGAGAESGVALEVDGAGSETNARDVARVVDPTNMYPTPVGHSDEVGSDGRGDGFGLDPNVGGADGVDVSVREMNVEIEGGDGSGGGALGEDQAHAYNSVSATHPLAATAAAAAAAAAAVDGMARNNDDDGVSHSRGEPTPEPNLIPSQASAHEMLEVGSVPIDVGVALDVEDDAGVHLEGAAITAYMLRDNVPNPHDANTESGNSPPPAATSHVGEVQLASAEAASLGAAAETSIITETIPDSSCPLRTTAAPAADANIIATTGSGIEGVSVGAAPVSAMQQPLMDGGSGGSGGAGGGKIRTKRDREDVEIEGEPDAEDSGSDSSSNDSRDSDTNKIKRPRTTIRAGNEPSGTSSGGGDGGGDGDGGCAPLRIRPPDKLPPSGRMTRSANGSGDSGSGSSSSSSGSSSSGSGRRRGGGRSNGSDPSGRGGAGNSTSSSVPSRRSSPRTLP